MAEVFAVLAVALLTVVFVLTQRNRGGCPGPDGDGCKDADGPGTCPGCPRH